MINLERAQSVLEFEKIKNMLAEHAETEGAKSKALRLMPEYDIDRIRLLLAQTSDAKRLAGIKGTPSFSAVRDVTVSVDRAEKGASLTPRELLDIAGLLSCARALIEYINEDRKRSGGTTLDLYFDRLETDRALENKINSSIIAEDMISDEASPALSDIRRKIRNANNRIKDSLQKYITSGSYAKYLQENIVTMRNGRYVIPVRAECRNEIKGLVHDTSASGATLFIEPSSVVEANNELRILENDEKKEIDKILFQLSALCAAKSDIISLDYHSITELAFTFAKAELSYAMDAAEPSIIEDKKIELYHARHPLLDKKKVVPINIRLGGDFDTLVITGPNTGGKTVSLKTLGLLVLMAQSGLHIPADESSYLPVFSSVFADIGDEQSIEQSLSTFSAHMKNIVSFMEKLNEDALVLFDELGAGTDPVEGAALAVAILEKVRECGTLCAATTHYAELKAFALDTKGVCNASCEFDVETLAPTYRLIIGTPGKSNAFAISEKLGLDSEIVNQARGHVSGDKRRFEYVIEKLEEDRIQMEKLREEAASAKAEYEKFRRESEAKIRDALSKADKELEKSKTEAARIVKSAKISSDFVLERLDAVKKQQDSANYSKELDAARKEVRKKLEEADNVLNPVIENKNEDYILPRPLKKGDEVLIVNINMKGFLEDDPDKAGNVSVKAGIMSSRTNIKNLRLIEEDISFTDKNGRKTGSTSLFSTLSKSFSPEIDLRGQLGDDAWFMVDKYLDDAVLVKVGSVRLIHGKGTGALRKRLWQELKNDRRVKSFRSGVYGEGDTGVTVVEVKI